MQLPVRHKLQLYDPDDTTMAEPDALVLPVRDGQPVMGETVAAYLARVAWRFELPTVCRINGEYYGRDEWATRALGVNDNVEFISRPGSSGSNGSAAKSITAIVAMMALTAVAGPLGGMAAGAAGTAFGFAAGSLPYAVAASLASAAIVGAGSLAISHFLSAKSGGKAENGNTLYNFGLQGNSAKPLQPIPVLNGRTMFAPEYAAPVYSEFSGDTLVEYGAENDSSSHIYSQTGGFRFDRRESPLSRWSLLPLKRKGKNTRRPASNYIRVWSGPLARVFRGHFKRALCLIR